MNHPIRYAVIGTGAIGGFYGGLLALAGEEVHFLLHSDYDQVRQHGLHIQSELLGPLQLRNVRAWQRAEDMPPCDVVLVCLKSTLNQHLLPSLLPPLLHPATVVVLIQNGLGVEEDVARLFPGLALAGGVALIAATKTGPGHIHHLEHGNLDIGNFNAPDPSRLEPVVAAFARAGIPSALTPDLHALRWRKLVWNIAFNGLSVLLNTTTDRLVQEPYGYAFSRELMLEVIAGAQACGVPLPSSFADDMLQFTRAMRPYAPSMKLDFDHHRPLEIKYIYETPVARARAAGYYMSKVDLVAQLLRFRESENIRG
ncbi:putative 2-dehydropantoate 2-reductase [Paraflavisolibacter sp. H34]|uniref:putative 2-dehydropantoate 2-reductase n=1 Tax=Huijunlia imazamoxiresistens TaxID=3127457 RepID=UPI0030159E3B